MSEEVLYTCPATGAACKLLYLEKDRGLSWENALRRLNEAAEQVCALG